MAWRSSGIGGIALAAALLAAGCGSESDYANDPRPPSPINVSAAITRDAITISPRKFGAGPVVLIIANQTGRAHRVTLETDELGASTPGIKQSTPPINPQGTATMKVDMREGAYAVTVADSGIRAARLQVDGERASAQDQLLQP